MDITLSGLKNEFETFNIEINSEDILERIIELCYLSGLNEENFVSEWMSYCVNHNIEASIINHKVLVAFDAENLSKIKNIVGTKKKNPVCDLNMSNNFDDSNAMNKLLQMYGSSSGQKTVQKPLYTDSSTPITSTKKIKHTSLTPSSLSPISQNMTNRAIKRKISLEDEIYDSAKEMIQYGHPLGSKFDHENMQLIIKILGNGDDIPLTKPYRYMYQNLKDHAAAQNYLIERFAQNNVNKLSEVLDKNYVDIAETCLQSPKEVVIAMNYLNDEEIDNGHKECVPTFSAFHLPTQESIYTFGQICADLNQQSQQLLNSHNTNIISNKLNPNNLILRGCKNFCNGVSTKIDITSKLKEYSLFPGQLVALKGMNPTGNLFIVEDIVGQTLPHHKQPKALNRPEIDGSIKIITAAGPFTNLVDLEYTPLQKNLSAIVMNQRPHICILIGPFVDCKHPLVENPSNEQLLSQEISFEELFYNKILKFLQDLTSSQRSRGATPTRFFIVSSHRDVFHRYNVYPTPPYQYLKEPKNLNASLSDDGSMDSIITFLPDPCMVEVNNHLLGITSTDILFQLGSEEISCFPQEKSDRMGRLVQHLISQGSFYPLYPPATDINIDYPQFILYGMMHKIPQILILPSDLKYFIKECGTCLAINPGRFVKGSTNGTFAEIVIPNYTSSDFDKDTPNDTYFARIQRL